MTSQDRAHKDIVRRLIAALNDHDRDTYANLITDDAVHYTPSGDALEGKAEFIEGEFGMYDIFPDLQYEIETIVAEDNVVALRGIVRGTADGEVLGLDVSGNDVEFPIMEFFRIEEGKVVEVWAQMSSLRWRQDIGAITDLQTQYQYLSVISRILRHNIRNDLSVIQGTLETARDRADDPVDELLGQAHKRTKQLLATAETARAAQTVLRETDARRQELTEVVESVVARAREQYPAATVEVTVRATPTVEATDSLEDALWELVANACEHAGETPHVEAVIDQQGGLADVTISDDGPGIPAHEREVLEADIETDLDHGSGLGLWIARWVLDASEGELTFVVNDGTTVRATLPVAPSSE